MNYTFETTTALMILNSLINEGVEYPEAEYRVSIQTGFSTDEIRAAYDSQF